MEGRVKKLKMCPAMDAGLSERDIETLLCLIPKDVYLNYLIPFMGVLGYYQLILAVPALYRTLVWGRESSLSFKDVFQRALYRHISQLEGMTTRQIKSLFSHLTIGSNTYLCGSSLLAILHGASSQWNDVDIIRTGFATKEVLFHNEVCRWIDQIEDPSRGGGGEKHQRELDLYETIDPLLEKFIGKSVVFYTTRYLDTSIVACITVSEKVQLIYFPTYESSVPNFHFDFCRISYGNGKLRFHGNLLNVLKKQCSINPSERFFKRHRYILSGAENAVSCIEKYRERGYKIDILPMLDINKIEDADARLRYREWQDTFIDFLNKQLK
jgi:hypothetical protein